MNAAEEAQSRADALAKELESEKKALEEEKQAIAREKADLEKERKSLEADLKKLKASKSENESDKKQLLSLQQSLEAERKRLENESRSLSAAQLSILNEQNKLKEANAAVDIRNKELDERNAGLDKHKEELDARKAGLDEEAARIKDDNSALDARKAEIDGEWERMSQEREGLVKLKDEIADYNTHSDKHLAFIRNEAAPVLGENFKETEFFGSKGDSSVVDQMINETGRYYTLYSRAPGSEEALLIKAKLLRRQRKPEQALVELARLAMEHPKSKHTQAADSVLTDIYANELRKDQKLVLTGSEVTENIVERDVLYLGRISSLVGKEYMPLISDQYGMFMTSYPDHEKSPGVLESEAKYYRNTEQLELAAYTYRKLIDLYPASPGRLSAIKALADLYENFMKQYDRAAVALLKAGREYRDEADGRKAFKDAAALLEEKARNYELAAGVHGEITSTYPGTEAARAAFDNMIRLFTSKARDYEKAAKAYVGMVDMFPGAKDLENLVEAAALAGKGKAYELQIEIEERIVAKYPKTEQAVEALYDIGETYERKLDNKAKALDAYNRMVNTYPGHKLAPQAQRRAQKLQ